MTTTKQIEDRDAILRFLLAGNARVTLVSTKTGARFTYRVRLKNKESEAPIWFVSLLTGSQNDADFSYLGTVFDNHRYRHGKKSSIGRTAPSTLAFAWLFARLAANADLSDIEVWHEGRCGRCGRSLTVPESIETGLGPICSRAA